MVLFFSRDFPLCSVRHLDNGIRWVQFNQQLNCSKWSYNLYKAWFAYRFGVASKHSQVKAWVFIRAFSPFGRLWNPTIVSQAPWDWKIPLFQLLPLSFLDFALHSLRFIECFTENKLMPNVELYSISLSSGILVLRVLATSVGALISSMACKENPKLIEWFSIH